MRGSSYAPVYQDDAQDALFRTLTTEGILRTRDIPWDIYMTARLISERDLQLLRRYDKKDADLRARLLDEVRRGAGDTAHAGALRPAPRRRAGGRAAPRLWPLALPPPTQPPTQPRTLLPLPACPPGWLRLL